MLEADGPSGSAKSHELLEEWLLSCRRANVAHLSATDSLTWRNYALSVTTAVLATIVGSSVYAALQSDAAGGVQFAVASLSVIAGVLAAVQNILRYGTRAEKHRRASRDYGNMMRWIRDTQACDADEDLCRAVERLRRRLDEIDLEAPNVPADIWIWAVHAVGVEDKDGTDASTVDRHHWPASLWHARKRRRQERDSSQ